MWAGVVGFSGYFVEFVDEHEESVEFSFAVWVGASHVCVLPFFVRWFQCMCRGGLGFVESLFLVVVWC